MNAVWLRRRGCSWRLGPVVLSAGLLVCALVARVHAQTVWELTPYRIQVVLAAGSAPELTPRLQADLREGLLRRVDAVVGAAWDVRVAVMPSPHLAAQVEALIAAGAHAPDRRTASHTGAPPPPALRRAILSDLEAITVDRLPDAWLDSEALDKVTLVALACGPTGYRITARELDVRTRVWNAPVRRPVWNPAELRDAVFEAVREAFAPLALVTPVEGEPDLVALRLRGAGIPLRDPDCISIKPQSVFLPVIRFYGRDGRLRRDDQGNPVRPRPVPWTFFTVQQEGARGSELGARRDQEGVPSPESLAPSPEPPAPSGQSQLRCTIHSGLRSPLSGRRRGRIEQLALGIRPPQKPTTLILKSRTDVQRALAGYDVYSHPPDSKKTELLGRTDREGRLLIEPREHSVRVLLVKHGSQLLARLPLVPGLEPEATATIAPDDERLEAEGFTRAVAQELVDLVTRREILLTQARSRLKKKEFDEAGELVRQLQDLDDRRDFTIYLNQERKKVASDDKLIQAKIDRMFNEIQKLVNEYLNPQVIEELAHQLSQARRPLR